MGILMPDFEAFLLIYVELTCPARHGTVYQIVIVIGLPLNLFFLVVDEYPNSVSDWLYQPKLAEYGVDEIKNFW